MESRYLARLGLTHRMGRRGLLARGGVLGGGVLSAVALGCGSSNNNNSKPATSAATKPATVTGSPSIAATSRPAVTGASPAASSPTAAGAAAAGASPAAAVAGTKKGGTLNIASTTGYPTTFDPHQSGGGPIRGNAYSRLLSEATGPGIPATQARPVLDAAAAIELVDPTTVNIKIRPNVKFQGPVSRVMTTDDVVFSYDRYRGKIAGTPASTEVGLNAVNIDTVQKNDAQTVQFKLKQPIGPYQYVFSGTYTAYLLPTETGTAFDVTKQVNGSGPWILDSFQPGSQLKWKRNPEWHLGPDRPFIDNMLVYVISEPAVRQTQFLGGNLDVLTGVVAGDVQRIKDSVKGVQLDAALTGDPVQLSGIAFSGKDPSSPWKDPRVRQAMSMAMDRDSMTQAAYDLDKLKSLGVSADLLWNNFVQAAFTDYWLDPKGNKIDPNVAKFFKYDPQGAKQLLSAAGFPNGFKTTYHYTDNFGAGWHTIAELGLQYLSKIGLDVTASVDDYQSVYVAHTRTGDFDGIAFVPFGVFGEVGETLTSMYIPGGSRNLSKVDDAQLTDRINKIQANTNADDRRNQILDIQNYLGQQMYYVPMQAGAGPIVIAYQPYLQNATVYHTQVGIPYNETYWGLNKS